MKRVLLLLAVFFASHGVADAEGQKSPAGYVTAIDLKGEDSAKQTVVVREGDELPARLMMPLYDRDVLFLRDPESRISIETGGEDIAIGGSMTRYEVKGEIATGDDAWSVISAIAGILDSSESEEVPDNMVSKGDDKAIRVPMTVRGPNFLAASQKRLWLTWEGGKGPFKIVVEVDGKAKVSEAFEARETAIDLPDSSVLRLTIMVRDSANHSARVLVRFRDHLPELPDEMKNAAPGDSARAVMHAAWLTGRHEGDWSLQAAQILHDRAETDQAAAALLQRIVKGWKLDN